MKENLLNLNNVRWICGEAGASIEKMFPDKSLDKIYMTFPDPWPKKRHWKHRLFQAHFIPLIARKLTDNGKFIFISDHEGYYQWCIELIEAQKELASYHTITQSQQYILELEADKLKGKRDPHSISRLAIVRKLLTSSVITNIEPGVITVGSKFDLAILSPKQELTT